MATARSLPTAIESELVRLAECPVCLVVPTDGVMLQCCNGHNVCAACKIKMGNETKCPQGECDYLDPPPRNKTVADIVVRLLCACKYSEAMDENNHSSCEYVDTRDQLEEHEAVCEHRHVRCLFPSCTEFASADRLVGHFETAHALPAVEQEESNTIGLWFEWDRKDCDSTSKFSICPYRTKSGLVFACLLCRSGVFYVWLQTADGSKTGRFECRVTLGKDEIAAPVYPIDWTREEITRDRDCVRLSVWSIAKMFWKERSVEEVNLEGFAVKFEIVKNDA
jgi:hypothetical protein